MKNDFDKYKDDIKKYSEDYRVLVLAHSEHDFNNKNLPSDIVLLGYVFLLDKIRPDANKTLEFFEKQGVDIKIISGDNPITVSKIAKNVGVKNYDKYIDMSTVSDDTDLKDIVRELYKKSDRIVISTNGFFTDRIVDLCKEFPQIGIRISIEGLEQTNNEIRGLQDGYQRGYKTLKTLRKMGMKDVGFGMTVQDKNAPDLVPLYKISDKMGMEFATASLHNSFYFVEAKNIIHDRPMVAKNFENLVNELLRSNSPKKWFRAYFNHGLINYIYGQKRLLPCDMSFDTFFIDPYGDVMPCNGTKDKEVMGNLNTQTWDELWNSPEAEKVRKKVRCCDRDCWMIGSVSPAMHKYIWKPAAWVVVHKFKALFSKHPYSMYELKICRDYRDGKVTKEQLDKCSTCDFNAVVNDGLSEASKEQLKGRTGEEIVDADIAQQMKEQD